MWIFQVKSIKNLKLNYYKSIIISRLNDIKTKYKYTYTNMEARRTLGKLYIREGREKDLSARKTLSNAHTISSRIEQ